MENVATEEFISRTEALEDFESCNAENPYWTPQRVKTLLLRQPAADVAEVVRCKYCRHLGAPLSGGCYDCKKYMLPYCRPDDFCSHGEYQTNTGGSNNVAD